MNILQAITSYSSTVAGSTTIVAMLATIGLMVLATVKARCGIDSLQYHIVRIALIGGSCCVIINFASSLIIKFLATKWLATTVLLIACIALMVRNATKNAAKNIIASITAYILFISGIHAIYGKVWLTIVVAILTTLGIFSILNELDSHKKIANANIEEKDEHTRIIQPQYTAPRYDNVTFRPFIGRATTKYGKIRYLDG